MIPESFLALHEECCAYFTKLQINTIKHNIKLFTTMHGEDEKRLDRLKNFVFDMYIKKYGVKYIPFKYFNNLIDATPVSVQYLIRYKIIYDLLPERCTQFNIFRLTRDKI